MGVALIHVFVYAMYIYVGVWGVRGMGVCKSLCGVCIDGCDVVYVWCLCVVHE